MVLVSLDNACLEVPKTKESIQLAVRSEATAKLKTPHANLTWSALRRRWLQCSERGMLPEIDTWQKGKNLVTFMRRYRNIDADKIPSTFLTLWVNADPKVLTDKQQTKARCKFVSIYIICVEKTLCDT